MTTSPNPTSPYSIAFALRGPARAVTCAAATIEAFRTLEGNVDMRAVAAAAAFARSLIQGPGPMSAAAIENLVHHADVSEGASDDPDRLLLTYVTPALGDRAAIRYAATCTTLPVEQLESLVAANPEITIRLVFRRQHRGRAWGPTDALTITAGGSRRPAAMPKRTP